MSKLIRNEVKKLFSKRLIYILFAMTLVFVVFINYIYNIEYSSDDEEYLQTELVFLEDTLKEIDYKTQEYNQYYIDLKTSYDFIKLKLDYDYGSWQYDFIEENDKVYNAINNINQNIYGMDKNEEELEKAQEEYNNIIKRLDSGDWQIFIKEELTEIKEEIKSYEEILKTIKDKQIIDKTNSMIEDAKIVEQALEWRLEKGIPYGNSSLSNKIESYVYNSQIINSLKNIQNKTKDEEQAYNDALKIMHENKYYIENNIDIENEYGARYLLINSMTEYRMFISTFTILIAGTIVSNEFQKGTIKLLLTKPFSRSKILFSKYIVSIISMFIFIILFILLQYIVGGCINGFAEYNVPVVEYNLDTNTLEFTSIFKYLTIIVLSSLPIYIFSSTFAFALSTITMNSAAAIALPILLHILSVTINLFVEKLEVLKYFITANWDLSLYLFGGTGVADGLNFWNSLIISILYIIVLLIITFVVFNKKDIKNV